MCIIYLCTRKLELNHGKKIRGKMALFMRINFIITAMRNAVSTNHRICCCGFRDMRVSGCRNRRWRLVGFYGQIRSWRRQCNKLMSGKSNRIYGLAIGWTNMARQINDHFIESRNIHSFNINFINRGREYNELSEYISIN